MPLILTDSHSRVTWGQASRPASSLGSATPRSVSLEIVPPPPLAEDASQESGRAIGWVPFTHQENSSMGPQPGLPKRRLKPSEGRREFRALIKNLPPFNLAFVGIWGGGAPVLGEASGSRVVGTLSYQHQGFQVISLSPYWLSLIWTSSGKHSYPCKFPRLAPLTAPPSPRSSSDRAAGS